MKRLFVIMICFLACPAFADSVTDKINLPPGFHIEIFVSGLDNPRSMTLSPTGVLYVGTRINGGNVYAIPTVSESGVPKALNVLTIASGLNVPNGVAFSNGSLYVAEINRVLVFENIEGSLTKPPKPKIVNQDFPSDAAHGWKFIRIGPDEKLYVPVGAPCNVCERTDDLRYASIMRMDLNGKNLKLFSRGVRNTVGFDWNPLTNELWFTDNGRDNLGDDYPPDELNRAKEAGMHFGFPYCHGINIPDPKFGVHDSCSKYTPPEKELGAHVAALGMRFYTGKMFPQEYQNQIFIAEHGSWNRTEKNGYRVMLVKLKDDKVISYEPFATGWWDGQRVWGRPVDLEIMPDGSLLVSDDNSGNIYRIFYK